MINQKSAETIRLQDQGIYSPEDVSHPNPETDLPNEYPFTQGDAQDHISENHHFIRGQRHLKHTGIWRRHRS